MAYSLTVTLNSLGNPSLFYYSYDYISSFSGTPTVSTWTTPITYCCASAKLFSPTSGTLLGFSSVYHNSFIVYYFTISSSILTMKYFVVGGGFDTNFQSPLVLLGLSEDNISVLG